MKMETRIDKNIVTIVTPVYNGENFISILYNSLLNQTDKNFKWMIIDDGSKDNTKETVDRFINENKIEINYIYKNNGGKHTALNYAFENVDTELTTIVDSDDFLKPQAIEVIRSDYQKITEAANDNIGVIIYLKEFQDGRIIGTQFHDDALTVDGIKYIINGNVKGDKAEVFVTKVLRKHRFKVFDEEKFMGETVVWIPIYREYKCFVRNESICVCEYLNGGLTNQGRRLRINNPLGGMQNPLQYIKNDIKLKLRIKNTLLFIAYRNFAKRQGKTNNLKFPNRRLYVSCYIPGKLLYFIWNYKYNMKGR